MADQGRRLIRALLTLGFVVAFAPAGHAIDWRWTYRTMRSPHFDLIYNETQKSLARHYLTAAERAHELVYPIFGEGPARTLIVLQDDTDEPNGSADFLPYPHITVYPVPPTALSGLGEYGDWALELMTHEYAHILNMHPAHGFYRPLSYVFGTILRPNAVLPTWYLEGLAVDLESGLTDHGRLRAVETRAAARALTLDDTFRRETIATINEQNMLSWPYGNRPYLFGGWWWETVVQNNRGVGVIGDLNRRFARRVPFLLNKPMRDHSGKTAAEWLETTKERVTAKAGAEIATLRAGGTQPAARDLVPGGGVQAVFGISPSGGDVAYVHGEPTLPASVLLKTRAARGQDLAEAPSRVLFRTAGTLQIRWLDDQRFVYDAIDLNAPYVSYRDLYIYDVAHGKTHRLTRGMRAQEPSPSPRGERVAFIRNEGGRTSLYLLDLKTHVAHRLLRGDFDERLGSPEFLGENDIVFTTRARDGRETLRRFDLTTTLATPHLPGVASASAVRRQPGGLIFTDAATGVRNAYFVTDGTLNPVALTDTLTHVGQVELDPQSREVVFVELTGAGKRLRAAAPATRAPSSLARESLGAAPPVPSVDFVPEDRAYSPWRYLVPRYWIPMVIQVENGAMFQGMTSNADPLGRHRYDLMASIDTVTKRPTYGLSYHNLSGPTDVGLSYGKAQTYLGASGAILQSEHASATSTQRWPWNSRRANWTAGGSYVDTTYSNLAFRRVGPLVAARLSNLQSPIGAWHGLQLDFAHQQYVAAPGYLAYGRSSVHLTNSARFGRGLGHRVSLETRAVFSPQLPFADVILLGERTVGGNYLVNLANSDLMMRGYPSANFIGRKVINFNLEYAYPLFPVDYGWGTLPAFWRSLQLALFVDAVGVDGAAYNVERQVFERTSLGHYYAGTGAELRFNTTVAYHAPLTFTLGLYYGTDRTHNGGFSPFFSASLGDLDVLKGRSKTP